MHQATVKVFDLSVVAGEQGEARADALGVIAHQLGLVFVPPEQRIGPTPIIGQFTDDRWDPVELAAVELVDKVLGLVAAVILSRADGDQRGNDAARTEPARRATGPPPASSCACDSCQVRGGV